MEGKSPIDAVFAAGVPAPGGHYSQAIGPAKSARSVIPVPELHYGYLVEIDAIAAQGEGNE